jgi:Trk K+ transport system NAD-binding subunit
MLVCACVLGASATLAGAAEKRVRFTVDVKVEGTEGVVGTGLATEPLVEAGIENACGIVVSTDNDAHNLAIVTAARRLRPKLFVVIRQNKITNRSLIDAARPDMRFVQSRLMAHECVQLMTTPLLNSFLMLARTQGNAWAVGLCGRIHDVVGSRVPHTWTLFCDPGALGIRRALNEHPEPVLKLAHLLRDPDEPRSKLAATPLLLLRDGHDMLLPDENTAIGAGDRILFAGEAGAESLQLRLLGDDVAIDYVRTGRERPRTWFGRWLERPA